MIVIARTHQHAFDVIHAEVKGLGLVVVEPDHRVKMGAHFRSTVRAPSPPPRKGAAARWDPCRPPLIAAVRDTRRNGVLLIGVPISKRRLAVRQEAVAMRFRSMLFRLLQQAKLMLDRRLVGVMRGSRVMRCGFEVPVVGRVFR